MKRLRALGLLAASSVLAAGCTQAPQPPVQNPILPRQASGDITVGWCTPARPLVPSNVTDACGQRVLDVVTARLTRADADTGAAELDAAASIESSDQRNFTVKLAPGRKFSDGTPLRARNFVSAWNWAAYGPNRQALAYQFDFIEGAAQLSCASDDKCSKDGRPTTISGLQVIDDSTFTITTTKPVTDLKARLASTAFASLPDSFFADGDPALFAKNPVGAGAFKVAGPVGGPELVLESVDNYGGNAQPRIRRVTLRAYDAAGRNADGGAPYADVQSGSLDFTNLVPTDQLYEDLWKTELKGRSELAPTRAVEVLTFVSADAQLTKKKELRKAISQGIDRAALTRQVFNHTRTPATGWVNLADYQSETCADACDYKLTTAKQRYEDAGGYSGKFWITVAGDGGHKQWADAMCNQLKSNLGLDCQVKVLINQAAVDDAVRRGQLTGVVWQTAPDGVLGGSNQLSLYASNSAYNQSGWSNAQFDADLGDASRALTNELAIAEYKAAESKLAADLPSIPLWYAETPVGWSSRLKDVHVTTSGDLDLARVTVQ